MTDWGLGFNLKVGDSRENETLAAGMAVAYLGFE